MRIDLIRIVIVCVVLLVCTYYYLNGDLAASLAACRNYILQRIQAIKFALDTQFQGVNPNNNQVEGIAKRIFHLLYMAPFFSGGGYSSEALSIAFALHSYSQQPNTNASVNLFMMQHGDAVSERFLMGLDSKSQQYLTSIGRSKKRISQNEPFFIICHSEPGAWAPALYSTTECPPPPMWLGHYGRQYIIGRTMFETDRINPEWVQRCNRMHQIWVPTRFHVKTFSESGVDAKKLVVIPEPVDTEFFDPESPAVRDSHFDLQRYIGQQQQQPPANQFRFLSIFKWEQRKGWDILIEAYFEEFSAKDNVALILLTSAFHSDSDFQRHIAEFVQQKQLTRANSVEQPLVYIINDTVPAAELPKLYNAADCFVLPSRGEGWGRPHVEAMSMELPVIATNWSGNTEFMNDENSYLLPIEGLETLETGPFASHRWAKPSVAHLRRLMRYVVDHPEEAANKGKAARRHIVERYTFEKVAEIILRQLQSIVDESDSNRQSQPPENDEL